MEIVFRALFMFFFLWIVTRAVGRGTLGELSTFQLLLFVTMGDLAQQSITQQDASVTGGVLAVGTFALLTVAVGFVNWKWPKVRPLVHGAPVVVIRDGELVSGSMKVERLSLDDLMEAAREQGVRRFADVELAVLEADGGISFFSRRGEDGAPERSNAA